MFAIWLNSNKIGILRSNRLGRYLQSKDVYIAYYTFDSIYKATVTCFQNADEQSLIGSQHCT